MRGLSAWGAVGIVMLLSTVVDARTATLRVQARLREGPAATTELLGWVPAGTRVEIVAESGGWRQVQTPDGRAGYIWSEHLLEGDVATPPPAAATAPPPAPARVPEEPRPAPATAADLQSVRAELERLTAAQRALEHRLQERAVPPRPSEIASPPLDAGTGLSPVAFLAGTLVGFAASWMFQRRRDRRQWNRLRV